MLLRQLGPAIADAISQRYYRRAKDLPRNSHTPITAASPAFRSYCHGSRILFDIGFLYIFGDR